LYEAGYETRLARGSLTEEKAEDLLQKMRKRYGSLPFPARDDNFQSIMDYADEFASKFQLNSTKLKEKLENQNKKQEQVLKKIMRRSSQQAEALISALEEAEVIKSSDDDSAEIKDLQDHWWVQINEDEKWLDLDPCLPESKPGQIFTQANDFYDPEDLTEEELHIINIRLIIEQYSNGKVKDKTVLEHTLKTCEMAGKHITLRHYPLNWPEDKSLFEGEDLFQKLKNVILQQKSWIPTLILEGDETEGTAFKDTGEIIKKKKRRSPVGSFRSMFEAKKETYLTAEWIEYELCSPGKPVRVVRREIFDLLGPAERARKHIAAPAMTDNDRMERCLKILGQTDVLVLSSRLTKEFIEYLNIENMYASTDLLLELFPMVNEAEPQEVLAEMAEIPQLPAKLYDTALIRSQGGAEIKRTFFDHANILSFHSKLKENISGEIITFRGLDIVENNVAVLDGDEFLIRLKQGVFDTNTEALLMDSGHKVYNASEIFNKGSEWVTLSDHDINLLEKIKLDINSKERIQQELKKGYIVIAPHEAAKINGHECTAWWRINPETGHTLGMGKHGWGQALTEYVEVAQTMIQLKLQIESYMGIMSCLMNTAAYALAGGDVSAEHKLAVGKCIWDTVCNYMMGKLSGFFLADTIWSNFIVEKTADWITGSLCGLAN
jgi:hypothetical protein